MQFKEESNKIRERLDAELAKLFVDKKPLVLYDPMVYPVEAGGKRLRPVLMTLACQSVGGTADDCIDAALAIELFHTFTLVHDDIMDHDSLRRGRPTVHVKWDESTAILSGDGLVIMAYQCLLRTQHPKQQLVQQIITDGLLELCEGQALDKSFEQSDDVLLTDYLEMIDKKTAKLIEVSCEVGGILGNASETQQKNLKDFGFRLGRAFQVQDDLLDLISDSKVLGKPSGSDLIEKKKTILTLHFLNHAERAAKEAFLDIWNKPKLDESDVPALRALLEGAGSVKEARRMTDQLLNEASQLLAELPDTDARKLLSELVDQLQTRLF